MKFELTYPEPLRTQAVHMGNQQALLTDAPKDNGGIGEAFSPTDLVAVGLASCIMTILGLRAASRNIRVLDMKADTEKKMSPNPRRVGRIEVGLIVRLDGGQKTTGIGCATKRSHVRWPCLFTRISVRTSELNSPDAFRVRSARRVKQGLLL